MSNLILDNLNFKGKIYNISHSKGSADGGISNSINVLELYFNYYGIQSDWITYDNISKIKQSKFLNKYLTSLNKFNSVVHFHGLWRPHSRFRNLKDILYVVSPHGMLMPHCLKRSRIKKYISSKIWEDNFIQNASYIFTLSIKEASTIPKKYKNKKIIVFPNSVLIPETHNNMEFIPPPWKDDIGHSRKVLLFLSRFDSIKGIYLLIDAWKKFYTSEEVNNWVLAIVGYGDNGKLEKFVNNMKNKNYLRNVFVYPPAFGKIKDSCFRNSDAFILPSYSEASPMSALEALSYGKPSIISSSCGIYENAKFINKSLSSLSDIPYIECSSNIKSIYKCLKKLFNMDKSLLDEYSRKSINFIDENYNAKNNLKELLKIYDSIIEGKRISKKYIYI